MAHLTYLQLDEHSLKKSRDLALPVSLHATQKLQHPSVGTNSGVSLQTIP